MRLWVLLPLVTLSISLVWGGVLQALIALQVTGFVADPARQATTLGIVLAVGAVWSTVVTPVLGMLSDRTGSRLGRRNVWIAAAGAPGAAMLVLTAMTPTSCAG